jgi:hypothetical protein
VLLEEEEEEIVVTFEIVRGDERASAFFPSSSDGFSHFLKSSPVCTAFSSASVSDADRPKRAGPQRESKENGSPSFVELIGRQHTTVLCCPMTFCMAFPFIW